MNLSLSYAWLKEHVKIKKSPKDFAREFSLHSQTIDRVREIRPQWKGVVTAKIVKIEKHPNAEKLRLATVEYLGKIFRVVCGAPNIEVGQVVPLVQENGRVVREGKPFIVRKANIRGVESAGMLCSQTELGIGEDHSGIFVLPPDTPVGVPLEKIAEFDDAIFDIEVTSNRPDCMSVMGIAREAGAVFGIPMKKTRESFGTAQDGQKNKFDMRITVREKKLCPRYQAVVLAGVAVGPSPLWMQLRLMASGIRPINNIVDITNYVMLEYGQPLHAFDYETLRGKSILVRHARAGEKISALDGNEYALSSEDLVIADAEKPVAIAGILGGENSSVKGNTRAIVLESANFDPVSVRKTSRRLSLLSESSNLFEKGLSQSQTAPALERAAELVEKLARGKKASKIFDAESRREKKKIVSFDPESVTRLLGISLSRAAIKKILQNLGFRVSGAKKLKAEAPWWRARDIEGEHDLAEEIARLHGYHNISRKLPHGEFTEYPKILSIEWELKCKKFFEGAGLSEVYTYSLVSRKMMANIGIASEKCLELSNPLSQDMQYLRPTLAASLLEVVSKNQAERARVKIFEISRVFLPKAGALPDENIRLGLALSGDEETFYECKGLIALLCEHSGISGVKFQEGEETPFWKKGASLDVLSGNSVLGRFGLVSQKILHAFGIKKQVSFANIDFTKFSEIASPRKFFVPLAHYPSVERDIALVVSEGLSWSLLSEEIRKFHPLIVDVAHLSTYRGKELGDKKSLAARVVFRSKEQTLTSGEVDQILKKLLDRLASSFQARLR